MRILLNAIRVEHKGGKLYEIYTDEADFKEAFKRHPMAVKRIADEINQCK